MNPPSVSITVNARDGYDIKVMRYRTVEHVALYLQSGMVKFSDPILITFLFDDIDCLQDFAEAIIEKVHEIKEETGA